MGVCVAAHRVARVAAVTATVLSLAALAGASGVDVEREARELEARLIAPCCFMQQVSVHHSPAANEVRGDIRRRLNAGQTRAQILDAYVERYGPRILAEPRAEGFGRWLYVLPPVALALTALFVVALVRRFTARPAGTANAIVTPAEPETAYQAELDAQLRDLD